MSLSDYIAGPGFPMPQSTAFTRLRATGKPSAANPERLVEDWAHPEELRVTGFLAASASSQSTQDDRRTTVSGATLTLADPHADVKLNDRIRTDPDDGRLWRVTGFPSADRNPFTGWQPTREIALEEVAG
jgi:hypothetical protein